MLRWYAYGAGSNDVLNQMDVVANTRQTFIPDLQGSILATLDSSTAALTKRGYLSYGESASVTGSFSYAGQRIDPETSGLYYARARMYAPGLGRFLQPDSIGYEGGINLYGYVENDPLNGVDPTGLASDLVQPSESGTEYQLGDRQPLEPGVVEAFNPLEVFLPVGGVKAAVGVTGAIVGVIAGKVLGREVVETVSSQFVANTATKLLNPPINNTAKGIAHVVERHTVNDIAKFAGKSKFNQGENLTGLINQATQQRMVLQANGNHARTFDVGRNIGIDHATGQQTSIMTVITRPNGDLVTAFPGRP